MLKQIRVCLKYGGPHGSPEYVVEDPCLRDTGRQEGDNSNASGLQGTSSFNLIGNMRAQAGCVDILLLFFVLI